jgi:hypothetical protein
MPFSFNSQAVTMKWGDSSETSDIETPPPPHSAKEDTKFKMSVSALLYSTQMPLPQGNTHFFSQNYIKHARRVFVGKMQRF